MCDHLSSKTEREKRERGAKEIEIVRERSWCMNGLLLASFFLEISQQNINEVQMLVCTWTRQQHFKRVRISRYSVKRRSFVEGTKPPWRGEF